MRVFFATFPLADKAGCDIQMPCKDRLAPRKPQLDGGGFNWLIDAVGANSFAHNLLTVRMNSHLRWILG